MAKKGKGKKKQPIAAGLEGGRCEIECVDNLLRKVDGAWVNVLARIHRRRNSFKMYGYYSFSGVSSLLVFIFALVVYIVIWNGYHTVSEDCLPSTPITSDADLMQRTLTDKKSFTCLDLAGTEEDVGAACDLQDMKSLLDISLASGVTMALQSLVCIILALGFRMFTNLPGEALQHGKTNWMSKCLGGICKLLPWFNRLCSFSQIVMLSILWLLIVMSYCLGDLRMTWNCRNYYSNCAYNKLKNCRYYYKVCAPDATAFLNCYVDTERAPFSGRVDVRLLTYDSCIRCQMLAADVSLVSDVDEFFFLAEEDRGGADWNCKSDATNCFSSRVMENIACNCATGAAEILDATKLTSLSANCAARRLSNESQSPRPCWQGNYSACDSVRKAAQKVASRFAGEPSDSAKAIGTKTHGSDSFLGFWEVESSRRLQDNASTATTLTQGDPISEQQCSWGPSSPTEYFFGSEDCEQHGSLLYRMTVLYCYLVGCTWMAMTAVGCLIRFTARPEPWFFQPTSPQEGCIWKFCRFFGP